MSEGDLCPICQLAEGTIETGDGEYICVDCLSCRADADYEHAVDWFERHPESITESKGEING